MIYNNFHFFDFVPLTVQVLVCRTTVVSTLTLRPRTRLKSPKTGVTRWKETECIPSGSLTFINSSFFWSLGIYLNHRGPLRSIGVEFWTERTGKRVVFSTGRYDCDLKGWTSFRRLVPTTPLRPTYRHRHTRPSDRRAGTDTHAHPTHRLGFDQYLTENDPGKCRLRT